MSQKKNSVPSNNFDFLYLEKLKQFFEEEINSNRRIEEISTVEDLLNVLESRDALTSDIFSNLNPEILSFISSKHNDFLKSQELIIPPNVVNALSTHFEDDWNTLGTHLKLTESQLSKCCGTKDVLEYFVSNYNGVSRQELLFRLIRALEKNDCSDLKSKVLELIEKKPT